MDAVRTKRITLRDVARLAGVAPSTVSYVINDTPGQTIRSETRDRVLAAVKELNYIPNAHARTMRGGRAGVAGVVISKNLAVPRFSQTLQGIQSRLDDAGLSLMLCTNRVRANGRVDYLNAFLERRVDGVVFLGRDNQGPDRASLKAINAESMPLVIYDCQMPAGPYSSVDLDYEGGARVLVRRVLSRHPRRLLYLRPDIDKAQEREREVGVRAAVAQSGSTELVVCTVPVTLDNLDTWDMRYSVGDTTEGGKLTTKFVEVVREAASMLRDGDAVVSSWSTWTDLFRHFCGDRSFVYGELANNGEARFAPGFYTRMPNLQVGEACADELLGRIAGKGAEQRVIRLDDVIDTNNAPDG